MKKEVGIKESIGKVLIAVEFSEGYQGSQCVFVFNDDTFLTIGIDRGYDPSDDKICEDKLKIFNFGDEALVRAGIVTPKEIASMREERDRKLKEDFEAREREELERLKIKFGMKE